MPLLNFMKTKTLKAIFALQVKKNNHYSEVVFIGSAIPF